MSFPLHAYFREEDLETMHKLHVYLFNGHPHVFTRISPYTLRDDYGYEGRVFEEDFLYSLDNQSCFYNPEPKEPPCSYGYPDSIWDGDAYKVMYSKGPKFQVDVEALAPVIKEGIKKIAELPKITNLCQEIPLPEYNDLKEYYGIPSPK